MPEPSPQPSSSQRRANWVGLRTLRQLPKLVGQTTDGDPVFEIRSARVMLRGMSAHFNRIAPCSRCGRDVPGAAVMTPMDLDRPLRPVICATCVRSAGVSTVWQGDALRASVERPGPQAPSDDGALQPSIDPAPAETAPVDQTAGEPVEVSRFDFLVDEVHALTEHVNELSQAAQARRVEGEEQRRADQAALSSLQESTSGALADARTALASVSSEVESRLAALEERIERSLGGVRQLVEVQRTDLGAVVGAVGQTRTELQRVADVSQELARAQQRLDQQLEAVSAQLGAPPDTAGLEALVAQGLAEVERRVTNVIGTQRRDLEASIESSASRDDARFTRATAEMSSAQVALEREIAGLAEHIRAATNRIDTLVAASEATNGRLASLEHRVERELDVGPLQFSTAAGTGAATTAGRQPPPPSTGGDSLLEAFELQLQGASVRLASMSDFRRAAANGDATEDDQEQPRPVGEARNGVSAPLGTLSDDDEDALVVVPADPVAPGGGGRS